MNDTKNWRRLVWALALLAVGGGAAFAVIRSGGARPAAAGAAGDPVTQAHGSTAEVPPEVAAALDRLRERLRAEPNDLAARKELAVRLAEHGQMLEAFEEAQRVLAAAPDDIDGLYVAGEVRVAMGQWDPALASLDRVLAQYPDHLLALIARGRAYAALGRVAEALGDWQHGLQVVGGHYPPIERLIAAQQGGSLPTARDLAAWSTATAGGDGPAARELAAAHSSAGEGPPVAAASAAAYSLRVDLAPGAGRGFGRATLFVALRAAAGSPPIAVKKLVDPIFPIDVALTAADSMMGQGQGLPSEGVVTARLDSDGDAMTRGPGDLSASGEAHAGQLLTLLLAGGGE